MRRWITLCLLLLLLAALTSCGRTANPEQTPGTDSPPLKEVVEPHEKDDMVTVSTVAELIRVIAPDAHIILKPGDYNFSALTEEEIESCGGYVSPDDLSWGEFSVYSAPGLTLEAEESGSVRLITENGYADVMTLTLCDGATLKGLILGHEIEKGDCDANVLELSTSQSVTLEDCGLFGCGTYGIWAENAAGLPLPERRFMNAPTVFSVCPIPRRRSLIVASSTITTGCFPVGETEVLIKDTEISRNQGRFAVGLQQRV